MSEVRCLTEDDLEACEGIDRESSMSVSQWVGELDDVAYGIFNGPHLIGYCTMDWADDIEGSDWDDVVIGNVYVSRKERGKHMALKLIKDAIALHVKSVGNINFFIQPTCKGVGEYYEKAGFAWVDEGNSTMKLVI